MAVQLLRTDAKLAGRGSHYHIVAVDLETSYIDISPERGHTHPITINPDTGDIVVGAAPDGHTHTVFPYDVQPVFKRRSEPEEQVVSQAWGLFHDALLFEGKNLLRAKEDYEFYEGNQWSEGTKEYLQTINRAAITVNFLQKEIDTFIGQYIENRTDIQYIPTEDGDQRIADILNILVKNIFTNTDYFLEERLAVQDQIIAGRGAISIKVDFSKKLEGEIKIESFPYDSVLFGEHRRPDASDAEYVIKHKFISLAKLEELYPKKIDRLRSVFEIEGKKNPDGIPSFIPIDRERSPKIYNDPDRPILSPAIQAAAAEDWANFHNKKLRVLEIMRKIPVERSVAVFPETNDVIDLVGWRNADVEKVSRIAGFQVLSQSKPKIRITRVAANVRLFDEFPANLPIDEFFIIPVYAYKTKRKWWGKVAIAKEAQQELNKKRSHILDILARQAAYGWLYDKATFPDARARQRFIKESAKPGFVLEVTNLSRLPQQISGTKFPQELMIMAQQGQADVKELISTGAEPLPQESGNRFLQRTKAIVTGNQVIFDNLSYSKKKLGRILISLIQKFYTKDRIIRIIKKEAKKDSLLNIGGQPAQDIDEQEIAKLLTDFDIANYDIAIAESDQSPTARFNTFITLQTLAQANMPIPPEILIEMADIPQNIKDRIIDGLEQQREAAGQASAQQSAAEILKTLIAKGKVPLDELQKFGIDPNRLVDVEQLGTQQTNAGASQSLQGLDIGKLLQSIG